MTDDLHDRLDRLAREGADGVRVTRPDLTTHHTGRRVWLPVGAVLAVVALVVGVVIWQQGNNGTDDVVTTDRTATSTSAPPTTAPARTPMVAVALGDRGAAGPPSTARLRFIGPDGSLIADRAWHEVEEPVAGGGDQWYAERGLLQRIPVGTSRIEVEDPAYPDRSCATDVAVGADSQIVVYVPSYQPEANPDPDLACATVTTAAAWAGAEGVTPDAQPYVGLTVADAEAKAKADGKMTRIAGEDGLDGILTADLRPDRVNLRVYDDHVLAASIG